MQRRLPKRGFKNYPFTKEFAVVNLRDLSRIGDIDTITPDLLLERGIIKNIKDGVKILSLGEVARPLTVMANAFSSTAIDKINRAGGRAEVI